MLYDANGVAIPGVREIGTTTATIREKERGFTREPPVSRATIDGWQAELERVVPRLDQLSWLKVVWEPGYAWDRRNRWVLWQMKPAFRAVQKFDASGKPHTTRELNMSAELWAALNGPDPMSEGHACFDGWCDCTLKHKRWVGGSAVPGVDWMTWKLFQETGCYGARWWVIQGENGGHRYALSSSEKRMVQFQSGGGDDFRLPKIAELPFAPFDERVLEHVRRYDKLIAWQKTRNKDFGTRTALDVQADQDAYRREGAALLMAHLKAQTDLWLNEHAKPWLKYVSEVADSRTQSPELLDEEKVTERFLKTASGQ